MGGDVGKDSETGGRTAGSRLPRQWPSSLLRRDARRQATFGPPPGIRRCQVTSAPFGQLPRLPRCDIRLTARTACVRELTLSVRSTAAT